MVSELFDSFFFRIAIFMFIIYQIHSSLSRRCKCEHCNDETLANALEFRCCHEVTNAIGKLVFDGSIENISCINRARGLRSTNKQNCPVTSGSFIERQARKRLPATSWCE